MEAGGENVDGGLCAKNVVVFQRPIHYTSYETVITFSCRKTKNTKSSCPHRLRGLHGGGLAEGSERFPEKLKEEKGGGPLYVDRRCRLHQAARRAVQQALHWLVKHWNESRRVVLPPLVGDIHSWEMLTINHSSVHGILFVWMWMCVPPFSSRTTTWVVRLDG